MSTLNDEYSLSKRVPDMKRGFTINTNYGDIHIKADEAEAIAAVVEAMLEKRITKEPV